MDNPIILLIATTKGIFTATTDKDRKDWAVKGPFLGGWEVYSVLGHSHPEEGHRIFAGTHHKSGGATIQMSDDLGISWAPVEEGPRFPKKGEFDYEQWAWIPNDPEGSQREWTLNRFWQLATGAPSQPNTLYAGSEEAALFVSHDRGNVWNEVTGLTSHPTRPGWGPGAGGMGLHTILVDPQNPKRIWVAMSCVGVFRTDDGGENWKVCNTGLCRVPTGTHIPEVGYCAHKVALDPGDSNVLYMQDHGGVNKSVDAGDTWFPIEEGLGKEGDERFGFPIAVSKTGDLYLMPLKCSEDRTMREGRMILYRSTNRGESWEPVQGDFNATTQYVNVLRDGMIVDDMDPYGVYFGTSSGEVFYSMDRGDSWATLPGRFPRITTLRLWNIAG